jgi:hypothetical protein
MWLLRNMRFREGAGNMRFKEGAGVQKKLESHMGWAIGGMLGMVEGISPSWFLIELGMGLAFAFGMMFGVEKQLSSPHSKNSIL